MRKMLNLPEDVFEYLARQDNASAYVARLVRGDMNSNTFDERIRRIVEEILKSKNLKADTSTDNTLESSILGILNAK
jgi:hypothetical protein